MLGRGNLVNHLKGYFVVSFKGIIHGQVDVCHLKKTGGDKKG